MAKITKIWGEIYRWPRHKPITNGLYTYTDSGLHAIFVETDEGLTGVGVCSGLRGSGDVIISILDALKDSLIGKDPLDNERHWYDLWRPKRVGRRGITTRVISGIDIALWDLKAKMAGMPLYKLLGGYTDSVDTYIAGGYYEEGKGLRELAKEMERNMELGATAVKMKIGAVPINEDVERVRVVRETVGPDLRLMVDANNSYRHFEAIQFAAKAEKYDLFWFEEPVEPDDYIGQREVTRSTSIPIAAGANEYTRYGFRDLIQHRAVDILQPNATIMGGVTDFMKVAGLAQAHDLMIAPHGNQHVHIQLVAAIPNGLILEYYRDSVDPLHGKIYMEELPIRNGRVYAPDRPGLGIEINRKALAQYRIA